MAKTPATSTPAPVIFEEMPSGEKDHRQTVALERIALALEGVMLDHIRGKGIVPDTPKPEPATTYPFPPKVVRDKIAYLTRMVKEGRIPCPECNGVGKHTPNCPDGPNRVGR